MHSITTHGSSSRRLVGYYCFLGIGWKGLSTMTHVFSSMSLPPKGSRTYPSSISYWGPGIQRWKPTGNISSSKHNTMWYQFSEILNWNTNKKTVNKTTFLFPSYLLQDKQTHQSQYEKICYFCLKKNIEHFMFVWRWWQVSWLKFGRNSNESSEETVCPDIVIQST